MTQPVALSNLLLRQTVENWLPRFLANGVDGLDARSALDAVDVWADWPDAWAAIARRYEQAAEAASRPSEIVTRCDALHRAALLYHFAGFVLFDDPDRHRSLRRRSVACYRAAAEIGRPVAQRFEVAWNGLRLPGYLRVPPRLGRPAPAVVIVHGLDSSKEEAHAWTETLLARGMATVTFDGPGQGEVWDAQPWTPAWDDAAATVLDTVSALPAIDPSRLGLLGYSFGAYLAPRLAAARPASRACVSLGGCFDLSYWDGLLPLIQHDFAHFVGAASPDEAAPVARRVSLADIVDSIQANVLIVHSGRDRIFPATDGERLAAAVKNTEYWFEPTGGHCCSNLHTTVRPRIADWLAWQLDAGDARKETSQ